jgi:TatA/E family protein of Tat protein translocase
MFGLGTKEIIILAGILVLFFGSKRIPKLARSLGETFRHIKGIFSSEEEKRAVTNKTDKIT